MTERKGVISKFQETSSLDSLGYFRLHNACELYSFAELEENLYPANANFLRQIRELTGKKINDIPIEFDLPPRPENDVSIEDVHLSLAELAGAATAIKFLTERNSVFFGPSRLGSFAKRWFHIINVDNPSPPPRETDDWMKLARGEKGLAKLDDKMTVPFRTNESLFNKFGITVTIGKDFRAAMLGKLTYQLDEQARVICNKSTADRNSLHALIGFSKIFYQYAVIRSSQTPFVNFVDQPLLPFSNLNGIQSIENIILIDRIKSYYPFIPTVESDFGEALTSLASPEVKPE